MSSPKSATTSRCKKSTAVQRLDEEIEDCWIMLRSASRLGMALVIPELQKKGFCLTSHCERNGIQAIHIAASRGHLNVVKALVQCEVSTAEADKDGRTALHHAVLNGCLTVVQFLMSLESAAADVNRGDGRGWNSLHYSCSLGFPDVTKLLLLSGVGVNCRTKVSLCAPLHFAAKSGHLQCAVSLVEGGAMVDRSDGRGYTSLHYAAKIGNAKIVRFLIKSKASVLSTTKRLKSHPLHLAAVKGNFDCMVELLKGGALANCQDVDNWTPLHCVACNGHERCAQFLVGCQADVHCRTAHRQLCPIHLAAQEGNLKCLQYLVSVGADPRSVDVGGSNAMHKAVKENKIDCVIYLLSINLDTIELRTRKHGRQPLHVAAAYGHVEVIKVLVEAGADFNATDNDGRSPLDLAKKNGHVQSARCITEYLNGCTANVRSRSSQEASNESGISSDDTTARAKAMMSISEDSDNRNEIDKRNNFLFQDEREQPEGKQSELITAEHQSMLDHYSTAELGKIAHFLGSSWKMVGRQLGLIDAQLQNLQTDYRESQLEQGYQMLIMWNSQIGRERGRDTLKRALEKNGIKVDL